MDNIFTSVSLTIICCLFHHPNFVYDKNIMFRIETSYTNVHTQLVTSWYRLLWAFFSICMLESFIQTFILGKVKGLRMINQFSFAWQLSTFTIWNFGFMFVKCLLVVWFIFHSYFVRNHNENINDFRTFWYWDRNCHTVRRQWHLNCILWDSDPRPLNYIVTSAT